MVATLRRRKSRIFYGEIGSNDGNTERNTGSEEILNDEKSADFMEDDRLSISSSSSDSVSDVSDNKISDNMIVKDLSKISKRKKIISNHVSVEFGNNSESDSGSCDPDDEKSDIILFEDEDDFEKITNRAYLEDEYSMNQYIEHSREADVACISASPQLFIIMKAAMEWLKKPYHGPDLKIPSIGRTKIGVKTHLSAKEIGTILQIPKDKLSNSYKCPIPGCDKTFKVIPSLKYHSQNYNHSILSFSENISNFMSIVTGSSGPDSEDLAMPSNKQDFLNLLNENRAAEPIITDEIWFYWEGHPSIGKLKFRFIPGFLVDQSQISSSPLADSATLITNSVASLNSTPLDWPQSGITFNNIKVLSKSESIAYGRCFAEKNLKVSGSPGIERLELEILGQAKINENISIINPGGSLFAAEWMPNIPKSHPYHYIALSGSLQSTPTDNLFRRKAQKCCIQIWRVSKVDNISSKCDTKNILNICGNYGEIRGIKWAPFNCLDNPSKLKYSNLSRLGLLAFISGDGFMRVIDIPMPESLKTSHENGLWIELSPVFKSKIPAVGNYTCLNWSNDNSKGKLICGTSSGHLQLFEVRQPFSFQEIAFVESHGSPVTSVQSLPKNESKILSTGLDGRVSLIDIRDPFLLSTLGQFRGFIGKAKSVDQGSNIVISCPDNSIRLRSLSHSGSFTKITQHKSMVQDWDISIYHNLLLTSTLDGMLAVSDSSNATKRGQKVIMKPLIKLKSSKDEFDGGLIHLEVGGKSEAVNHQAKFDISYSDSDCIIQSVSWNPDQDYSTSALAAFRNGLCLIIHRA